MGGPWVVIQHAATEGPGTLAAALERAGVSWSLCRVDQGEPLPALASLSGLGGLVTMGGPMGVHDAAEHPWLGPERRVLAAGVEAGLVVLGVCLGAQQLAMALGAEVWSGERPEIGQGQVTLTAEGLSDPVLGGVGSPLPCLHWHGDTFSLPPSAVRLASSPHYPNQAFRVGAHAYGLQFHLEVDAEMADLWTPDLPPGVELDPGRTAQIEGTGRRVWEALVARAGPARRNLAN
jgi:GMP synthase (glutamine-hydrolysing)